MSSKLSSRATLACLLGLAAVHERAIAGPSAAAEWVAVTSTSDRVIYVDKASLLRGSHGLVRGWIKTVFKKPQDYPAGGTYLVTRIREAWDCTHRTYRASRYAVFKDLEQSTLLGESVSQARDRDDMQPVPPDTVSSDLLDYACANVPRRTRPDPPKSLVDAAGN